ncbi:cilia- and flagella-associated protein 161-like [Trichogramma pretiosum]|uniref:cilia- and flagella-associated protein 161-like n=1 Tax=Trichogramma pretiosum TaxID=7493 RepID=UPI0006C9B6CC|nr:cilia- and flagella-associated protein 161-like [Trichogramma pretiosum]
MYSGRVLVGFWFNKLQLESEQRELEKKRLESGQLPEQIRRRLVAAFGRALRFTESPASHCDRPIRYGDGLQLHSPESPDVSDSLAADFGCPEEDPQARGPSRLGLVVSATVSQSDCDSGQVRGIRDGCGVACAPIGGQPCSVNNSFVCVKANRKDSRDEELLTYGTEVFFALAWVVGAAGKAPLYLRMETPLLDGQYVANDHYPLRLSSSPDGYAKWRVLHWDRSRRFETEASPVLPCVRIVVQHVMTGQCLACERYHWHRSLLGYEAGLSVHTYSDAQRNETAECVWNLLPLGPSQNLELEGDDDNNDGNESTSCCCGCENR